MARWERRTWMVSGADATSQITEAVTIAIPSDFDTRGLSDLVAQMTERAC